MMAGVAPSREQLKAMTVSELKSMCDMLNTPRTGNKDTLIVRVMDPASHQRKIAKRGEGVKKKSRGIHKKPRVLMERRSLFDHIEGFGSDSEEDGDFCECCEDAFPHGEVDPHNGLCFDCFDKMRPEGGCSCWRMNCQYDDESGCFECDF